MISLLLVTFTDIIINIDLLLSKESRDFDDNDYFFLG